MRWSRREAKRRANAKRKARGEWHPWFAWRPVYSHEDQEWIWLEWCQRMRSPIFTWSDYRYKRRD